jgi:hypothetical protein
VEDNGLERNVVTPCDSIGSVFRPDSIPSSDAVDDAILPDLAWIIDAWPSLPKETQNAILQMAEDSLRPLATD